MYSLGPVYCIATLVVKPSGKTRMIKVERFDLMRDHNVAEKGVEVKERDFYLEYAELLTAEEQVTAFFNAMKAACTI